MRLLSQLALCIALAIGLSLVSCIVFGVALGVLAAAFDSPRPLLVVLKVRP